MIPGGGANTGKPRPAGTFGKSNKVRRERRAGLNKSSACIDRKTRDLALARPPISQTNNPYMMHGYIKSRPMQQEAH
jgi:hypothetical protein